MRYRQLVTRSHRGVVACLLALLVGTAPVVAQAPTPPRLPPTTKFRLWERGPAVRTLRGLLAKHGLLDSAKVDDPKYDLELMKAVRAFQRRAGLKETGIPRRDTLIALNKPPSNATPAPATPPAEPVKTPPPAAAKTEPDNSLPPAPAQKPAPASPAPIPRARPQSASAPTPAPAAPAASVSPPRAANTSDSGRPMLDAASLRQIADAISRYREIAAAGGWQPLAGAARFTPAQQHEMIPALRARLVTERYLAPDQAAGATYDATLAAALHRFQRNHGVLERDAIDSATLKALNVPVALRLAQLESTLARLRQQKINGIDLAKESYVLLNIPARTVEYVVDGRVLAWRKAIVGKRKTKSPELVAYIDGVTLDPTWHVPQSIVRREIAPMLRRHANYLDRHGMRITLGGAVLDPAKVDWKKPVLVVQQPGPHNSLGVLRIDMPNRHAVYLHDTPQRRLFDSANRYFSHGCARIEDVVGFAAILLRDTDPALTKQTLVAEIAAYDGGWEPGRKIKLKRKIRVIWSYMTAWVTDDGSVAFRRDVYGRDRPVASQPAQPVEATRAS